MILLFAGEKGGVGKSTKAENMAVQRTLKGKRTLLVDSDPQKTATKWVTRRIMAGVDPAIRLSQQSGRGLAVQIRMLQDEYDDIIIDSRGADGDEVRSAMLVADVLISPAQPSQNDIETFEDMESIIDSALHVNENLKCFILTNLASPHPNSREADDMREFCAELRHFKVMNTMVRIRKAYRDASSQGKGIIEMAGGDHDPKAVFEMLQLEQEIWK